MNTTIISDLFLLVSSVNDKLSPVLVQASFLLISNSVSKISPSLMKERWEISRVKAWDRCYCLSWMSLISDRNFYHFCHNLLLMASGQCPTRWMDVVDFFWYSKSITSIVLDFVDWPGWLSAVFDFCPALASLTCNTGMGFFDKAVLH